MTVGSMLPKHLNDDRVDNNNTATHASLLPRYATSLHILVKGTNERRKDGYTKMFQLNSCTGKG